MSVALDELASLRERIRAEERVAGLPVDGRVSGASIRRRRWQLAVVGLVVLVGLAASSVADETWRARAGFVDPGFLRVAMTLLTFGIVLLLLEKERHLKRLDELGRVVHDHDVAVADGLLRTAAVADAGRSIAAALELDAVLARIADRATRLVGAGCATVHVPGPDGEVHLAASSGVLSGDRGGCDDDEVATAAWEQGAVVSERPEGRRDHGVTRMAVPLGGDGLRLGVLVVTAREGDAFADVDVDVVTRLAAVAVPAIANARRHEATLAALERARAAEQLLAGQVWEPVAAIREELEVLRRADASVPARAAAFDALDDAVRRLAALGSR